MDWSLVLASQGIEPAIEAPADGLGWGLLVREDEHARAVEAIRLYERENRHWPWQQRLSMQELVFDWTSVAWGALLILFFWLAERSVDLQKLGEMNRFAVNQGQWWRLFTAVWLHADIAHLAGNVGLGIILLGLAMGRYGTTVGLLAAYLAGASGNAVVWLLAPGPHPSLGASGMVMGALGLLAMRWLPLWRKNPHARRFIVSGLLGGVLLFVFLGTSPGSDVLAHAGGFVSGILLGSVLNRFRGLAAREWLMLVAGLVFLILILWPWWLALRHS